MRLLRAIHEANDKFAKKNVKASEEIDARLANAIMTETDKDTQIMLLQNHTALRAERIAAGRVLEEGRKAEEVKTAKAVATEKVGVTQTKVNQAKVDPSTAQLNAMNKRAGLTEAVDAQDNNPRQAEALVAGLKILEKR